MVVEIRRSVILGILVHRCFDCCGNPRGLKNNDESPESLELDRNTPVLILLSHEAEWAMLVRLS